jgi:uncharacterized protein YbjT (DUF2867 family)
MNVVLSARRGWSGRGAARVPGRRRREAGGQHRAAAPPGHAPKLTEIVHADFFDYTAIDASLRDADACFFCLGVSSVGMKEEDYRHTTYDLTMAAANTLHRLNPALAFIYVSGAGTRQHRKRDARCGRA